MGDHEEAAKGVTSVFPFVMVISAFFATGLVFLAVDVPLLLECAGDRVPGRAFEVLWIVPQFWQAFLTKDYPASLLLLCSLGALVLGFVLQPPAQVAATFVGKLVTRCSRIVSHRPPLFYAPPIFFGSGYARTADWLHRNPVAKSHWEWEMFNHYLYAGLALNSIVGAIAFWKLWSDHAWWQVVILAGVCLLTIAYSLARSAALHVVYSYYEQLAEEQPPLIESKRRLRNSDKPKPDG